jgi:beta-galactosidase
LYRSFNGLSGLMELQPGQVNWGEVNPWPLPGATRMWILRAFGAGANLVNTYRYRQPLSGSELFHKGIVETDGVTLSPGGKEYVQAIQDVTAVRKLYKPGATPPSEYEARRTAFLISWDDRWDIDNHRQNSRWSTDAHWMRYYRALKSMTAPVDVMSHTRDYSRYKFVVAPAWEMARPDELRAALEFARKGGHLILTCRTGLKDHRGHLWEGPWAQPLLEVIGAVIPFYDVLPSPVQGTVRFEDKTYAWATWGEILEAKEGTRVLATYADQFYAGRPAAVTRKVGQGSITYVGVDSLDGELERAILQRVYSDAGAKPALLPPGFIVDWRDGFWVATNFTEKTYTIPAGANATMIAGSREVAPAGVAIWMQ